MGWERKKTLITELSSPPSLNKWLFAGLLMAITGMLLFIMHASGTVKTISGINIWSLSLAPVGCWLLLFCLRSYLWGREVKEYQFLCKEAEYAQQQWEVWAARHLAIAGSLIFLPDKISARMLTRETPQQYGLARRIDYLPAPDSDAKNIISILLDGLQEKLDLIPEELPLKVTLLTDVISVGITDVFSDVWQALFPNRTIPGATATHSHSFAKVEEYIKQPGEQVELILVMQLNGHYAWSDALAALLLTSDDVAQKYQLPHAARLLRPMPLTMATFEEDITLFLETQTIACQTSTIMGDEKAWAEKSAALISTGWKMNSRWKAEDIALLEKWCGIPGPFASWLLTALAADMVSLQRQPLLALFTDDKEHFISTIVSGSEDEHTR